MPYICSRNTANNGVLQIKDLYPNKSQYNPTLSRSNKNTYIKRLDFTEMTLNHLGSSNGTLGTSNEMRGLASFFFMENLFVNFIGGGDSIALGDRIYFANLLTVIVIDIIEENAAWNFEEDNELNFFLGFSEGSATYREKFLAICAGADYIVPVGTVWGDEEGHLTIENITTENFVKNQGEYKITGQYWESSFNHGELKTLIENGLVAVFSESGLSLSGVDPI